MWRKFTLALIVTVGLVAIGSLFLGRRSLHSQVLKSCFTDVHGLKRGAEIRIAGVDVGTVQSVRSKPQDKNCPAEVTIEVAAESDLRIPRDALTEIDTAGVLGGSFVTIDVTQASGLPIENYGYLKSKPAKRTLSLDEELTAARALLELEAAQKSTDKTPHNEMPASSQTSKH